MTLSDKHKQNQSLKVSWEKSSLEMSKWIPYELIEI